MNKTEIISNITGKSDFTPYLTAETFELDGAFFCPIIPGITDVSLEIARETLCFNGKESAYHATKVEEDLYLIGFDGKLLLLNTADSTGILQEADAFYAEPAETVLPGWENEFHYASKLTYVTSFTEDSMTIGEETWPASYAQVGDHMIVVSLSDPSGNVLFVLNMDRFVFCGGQNGEVCISGAIEVPFMA